MKACYDDITNLIASPPAWWDENGVPRYCDFHPEKVANIYAREAALIVVRCQSCSREFRVSVTPRAHIHQDSILEQIRQRLLGYGDPPNVSCCPAGASMNSVPVSVIGYWWMNLDYRWQESLAVRGCDIVPDWAREDGP